MLIRLGLSLLNADYARVELTKCWLGMGGAK